jgi:hypothetical protein
MIQGYLKSQQVCGLGYESLPKLELLKQPTHQELARRVISIISGVQQGSRLTDLGILQSAGTNINCDGQLNN